MEEGIAVDTRDDVARFNDRLKAAMAAAANLFFLVAVSSIWVVEVSVFDTHQLPGVSPLLFAIGELLLIVYFAALAASDRFGALIEILVSAARSGISKDPSDGAREDDLGGGRLRRLLTNLWTPVTLSFLLAGALIYASGGVVNSPYSQVPVAMMLIGQSVYRVPPVELSHHTRIPRVIVFAASVARLYCYPLLIIVSIEVSLVVLQATYPLVTTSAPTAELLVTTLVTCFAGMCVTFVTRRADQAGGAGAIDALEAQFETSAASVTPRKGASAR
jgi:uncharacterized membrane protein YqjE